MKRYILIILGIISCGFGFLGAILPILPTFPFAVAALYCFSASSPRFKSWLINNKVLGPSIKRFHAKEGLSIKTKISILAFTWLSVGSSILFLIDVIWVKWMLIGILVLQAWVIIRYKTYKENKKKTLISS